MIVVIEAVNFFTAKAWKICRSIAANSAVFAAVN